MEQGYIPQRNLQQGIVLGWTQQSVLPNEAVDAPSQSASSAVISPASHSNNDAALSESSGQSSSSLKERDYIGLAEVSSAPSSCDAEISGELNLAETDLRLGLGPTSDALDNGPESLPSSTSTSHKPEASEMALHVKEDVSASLSMPTAWQSVATISPVGANPIPPSNGFQGTFNSAAKNGGKRMYAEAMANGSRDARSLMNLNSSSGGINVCDSRSSTNQVVPMKQFQDIDKKAHPLHPQGVFWTPPPHVPSWQAQANYRSVVSQNAMVFSPATGEKDGEVVRNSNLDIAYLSDKTRAQARAEEENTPDDAPPAKGQVVGWPPVRSYRRSTLATRTKPTGDEGDGQSAVYVKVNMEGIPIGRKVDLNAYKSYDSLLTALEDMFHNPNSGPGARFLKGPEFVLTYEDKEGDWMLVGDVPWGMFVNTVRRLRITRGSDMTGLGSRTSCHA